MVTTGRQKIERAWWLILEGRKSLVVTTGRQRESGGYYQKIESLVVVTTRR